jgi:uncharacterized LabA/DUF88 family protein
MNTRAAPTFPGVFGPTAIFVDAGWLLAAAALEVIGSATRDQLACDYSSLIASLSAQVDEHSGGAPRLRTYWYDAAPGGAAGYEHDRIAALPYVQVRLGRLSRSGHQKGVDVLIYNDVLALARERAIRRAYLVAGDEDLAEGVAQAQQLGIQVVLLGMPSSEGHNQSPRLVRQCDESVMLARQTWEPHFSRRTSEFTGTEPQEVATARRLGAEFARDWCSRTPVEQVHEVLEGFPTLPQALDIELLRFAEEEMGSLRRSPDLKKEMRATFWFAVNQVMKAGVGGAGPADDG